MNNPHYQHGSCETVDFVELVLANLGDLTPEQHWQLGNALKYACRAGFKGDWRKDAVKCADFLHRACTGDFLTERKTGKMSELFGILADDKTTDDIPRVKRTVKHVSRRTERSSRDKSNSGVRTVWNPLALEITEWSCRNCKWHIRNVDRVLCEPLSEGALYCPHWCHESVVTKSDTEKEADHGTELR